MKNPPETSGSMDRGSRSEGWTTDMAGRATLSRSWVNSAVKLPGEGFAARVMKSSKKRNAYRKHRYSLYCLYIHVLNNLVEICMTKRVRFLWVTLLVFSVCPSCLPKLTTSPHSSATRTLSEKCILSPANTPSLQGFEQTHKGETSLYGPVRLLSDQPNA